MISSLIQRLLSLKRSAIIGLVLTLATVGVVAFVLVARLGNTHPSQCASCHPRISQLWEESLVHPANLVTCYQCHAGHPEIEASPNLLAYVRDTFIPEKYMASRERINGRCLDCHAEIASAETERGQRIRVNHKKHLAAPIAQSGRSIELGCIDCHENIAHDKAEEFTNRPRMFTCFTAECHEKERNRDRCTMCHYQMLVDTKLLDQYQPQH